MSLKPPKSSELPPELPDNLKLVDELVKKSLEVNPQMRAGKSTSTFLEEVRARALAQQAQKGSARTPSAAAPSAVPRPAVTGTDARTQTLVLFMRERGGKHESAAAELARREAELAKERERLCARTTDEIVDMLVVLLASGASPRDIQNGLRVFSPLLLSLGVSDSDLIRLAKARAGKR